MSLQRDLLEQAHHLARREKTKPRQASLRRSTSTAYYAIFHLLGSAVTTTIAPNLVPAAKARLQRALSHKDMKTVCSRFLQTPVTGSVGSLLGAAASTNLRQVALAFIQLQDARHSADYDLNSTWDRAKATNYVQMARDAFAAWEQVKDSHEANVFLLSLILFKQLDALP
jgi:hypothetical protein